MAIRNTMDLIRAHYNVPAKRGGRVCVIKNGKKGWITGSKWPVLLVRLDGQAKTEPFHPRRLEYL